MRDLPSGTVTFVFTDIEGSTRLLRQLGDAYPEVLAEHRRTLREVFGRHGGVEVDTQGDAFFYAFPRAGDAASAANEAQRALANGTVRVRIGVHTGEPRVTDEGYVGVDVNRAARIMSAGHGGQVLVSEATRRLLDSTLALRDLGEHRLKDVDRPERIFQLGEIEFPPLKSLNNTNVPHRLEPLLGRKRELADLLRLVRSEGARLVTLTGPGGIGKTRLALELASELIDDFAHGVWFVDLSAVRDAALVEPTIAGTLGARGGLAEHVGDRRLLIVVDNFEQVVDAAPALAGLLRSCGDSVVVVTSREPLRLGGEREYPLRPLAEAPAVELFRSRAEAAAPQFDAPYHVVADICARLDSLPLAIELAAAHAKALRPDALRDRLDQRLPLLRSGRRDAPARQRTLRAAIEWSYDLLSPAERSAFARLAVFTGAWTLTAAETVAGVELETLESLVAKSLVRHEDGEYSMLATIREYAAERLGEDDGVAELRRRHADYFLELAERAAAERASDERLGELDSAHDNLRAALSYLANVPSAENELRLVVALEKFWIVRGYLEEGATRVESALARAAPGLARLRAAAHAAAADFARLRGDAARATTHAETSFALAEEAGDSGLATRALHELGEAAQASGDYERAERAFRDAIAVARAAGKTADGALANLGDLALARGEFEQALEHSEEALKRFRAKGAAAEALVAEFNVGAALFHLGRTAEARNHFKSCLEGFARIGYSDAVAWSLLAAAATAARGDDAEAARRLVAGADLVLERIRATLGATELGLRNDVVARVGAPSTAERQWAAQSDAVESLARRVLA